MAITVKRTVIQMIASTLQSRRNCLKANASLEWVPKHEDTLKNLQYELPSGSGIDHGTKIDLDASNDSRIVLQMDYHHMNENGYYDGWTSHTIKVTPTFEGFDLAIGGRDRNQIKEYLADILHHALSQTITYGFDDAGNPTNPNLTTDESFAARDAYRKGITEGSIV